MPSPAAGPHSAMAEPQLPSANGSDSGAVNPVEVMADVSGGEEVPSETAEVDGDDVGAAFDDLMRRSMVLLDVDVPLVALADGVHSRAFSGK
jgi:hypothetical protein